ncbi:hypothetical protein [Mesorhizobium sp. M0293]|uniref:hypothetical protein n=1 Tax=Mesorhizobium sp. M0293 TaxID=2956930 RepID=UPI003336D192
MTNSTSEAVKPLILNGFGMTVVGHVSAGLWRHPSDRAHNYTSLEYWTSLAKLLDDGGFDALFLADALGHLDGLSGHAGCVAAYRRPVAGERPAAAGLGNGRRHQASWVRHHRVDDL